MRTQKEVIEFEQVVGRGCGMDVHKETVVATVAGVGITQETRTFSTFTNSLKELREWLRSLGITHVAMESTGVYWKPVFNILEADFKILLVNARHVKNVPGHKMGYINKQGRVIIKPQFDNASGPLDLIGRFSEGLAVVSIGEKRGFINKLGKIVIKPKFTYAEDFSNGLARVHVGQKRGYINKSGRYVWLPSI